MQTCAVEVLHELGSKVSESDVSTVLQVSVISSSCGRAPSFYRQQGSAFSLREVLENLSHGFGSHGTHEKAVPAQGSA